MAVRCHSAGDAGGVGNGCDFGSEADNISSGHFAWISIINLLRHVDDVSCLLEIALSLFDSSLYIFSLFNQLLHIF
jgi:hypothetical protein